MIIDYFQWQFVLAPSWLLKLFWNLEQASLRFFSVKFMFRTLLSYWHKDAVSWKGGTLTQYAVTIVWNVISRVIGFILRTIVILSWVVTQVTLVPMAMGLLVLFIMWPLLVIIGISTGLSLFMV